MKAMKFTDKTLADLRHSQFEFTYIAKDGSTKTHKQLDDLCQYDGLNRYR